MMLYSIHLLYFSSFYSGKYKQHTILPFWPLLSVQFGSVIPNWNSVPIKQYFPISNPNVSPNL